MQEENVIKKIEAESEQLSIGIVNKFVKKVLRELNKMEASMLSENYPSNFNFVDVLSIERQTKYYDEIVPGLQDTIQNYLNIETMSEYLTREELFVLELTNTYEYEQDIVDYVYSKVSEAFGKALNDHYENTKKIQNYVDKCPWL